jgi:hypothetical protein
METPGRWSACGRRVLEPSDDVDRFNQATRMLARLGPLLVAWVLISCTQPLHASSQADSSISEPSQSSVSQPAGRESLCALNVDSALLQLSEAEDQAAFAAERGMPFSDGLVGVIVELRDGLSLTPDPTMQVQGQYGNLVELRLSPSDMCALAARPEVLRVRSSYPPIAQ